MLSKAAGIFYSDCMRAYEGIYELRANEFSFSSWNKKKKKKKKKQKNKKTKKKTQKLRTSLRASENY